MSKQNKRKYLARLITELVNRDPKDRQCLSRQFVEKYGLPRFRFGTKEGMEVLQAAQWFRAAWDKSNEGREKFAFAIEQVFADRFSEIMAEVDAEIKELQEPTGTETSSRRRRFDDPQQSKYKHAAFR